MLPLPPVLQHDRVFYAQVFTTVVVVVVTENPSKSKSDATCVCAFESAGKAASTQWRQMWANRSGHCVGGGARWFDGVAIASKWVQVLAKQKYLHVHTHAITHSHTLQEALDEHSCGRLHNAAATVKRQQQRQRQRRRRRQRRLH